MKKMLKLFVLASLLAAAPSCKKKTEEPVPAATGSAVATGSGSDTTAPATGSGSADVVAAGSGSGEVAAAGSGSAAPAVDPAADYIKVHASHSEKKPEDPVEVAFSKFTVKKADFDPAKIEGGSATIEVDLTSLKTNSEKRDAHLNTPDYLDTAKFATATIDIGNVKKKDDKNFTADAKINLHGVEKTYPVAFEIVETGPDWIKVRGEHVFPRTDFKVGKDDGDGVAKDLTVKVQLTLKKV